MYADQLVLPKASMNSTTNWPAFVWGLYHTQQLDLALPPQARDASSETGIAGETKVVSLRNFAVEGAVVQALEPKAVD